LSQAAPKSTTAKTAAATDPQHYVATTWLEEHKDTSWKDTLDPLEEMDDITGKTDMMGAKFLCLY